MQPQAPESSEQSRAVAEFLLHRPLLLGIAMDWYRLPPADSEPLVHEVFMTYWKRRSQIEDLRRWLIGAIIRACRLHFRKEGRSFPLPDDFVNMEDPRLLKFTKEIEDRLSIRKVLNETPEKCRDLITERFLCDRTLGEIAEKRGTTENYAKKLVYGCLKDFRRRYLEMTEIGR